MNKKQIKVHVRKAYDIGYEDGRNEKPPESDIVSRLSDEDMIAGFLKNNKVTKVNDTKMSDVMLGEVRVKTGW